MNDKHARDKNLNFKRNDSEEGRDVFVGGYSGSSILATLLPASPLNAPLYPPSTTPFAGSKDLVEGESAVTRIIRVFFYDRRDWMTTTITGCAAILGPANIFG
ncbi:hypothetical protein ACS0PU_003696 [Formica fusca]